MTALTLNAALRLSDKTILVFTVIIIVSGITCKTSASRIAKVFVTVTLQNPIGIEIAKVIIHINAKDENFSFLKRPALENCALIGEHTTYQRSTLNAAKQNMEIAYAAKRTPIIGLYNVQNVSFNVTSSREFSVACPAIFNAEKRKSATATLRRKR